MLLTSTQTLTNQPYEELGLVRAASVYSKNIAKDIGQSLKSVVGGELRGYTDLLEATAEAVTAKLEDRAQALGADAVIAIGYTTSNVTEYGTGGHRQRHRCEARVSGEGEYRRKMLWIGNDPEHFCVFCAEMGTKIESAFA